MRLVIFLVALGLGATVVLTGAWGIWDVAHTAGAIATPPQEPMTYFSFLDGFAERIWRTAFQGVGATNPQDSVTFFILGEAVMVCVTFFGLLIIHFGTEQGFRSKDDERRDDEPS